MEQPKLFDKLSTYRSLHKYFQQHSTICFQILPKFIINISIIQVITNMGNCQNSINLQQLPKQQSQQHLMNHWKNISSTEKRRTFQQQLQSVNVGEVLRLYKKSSFSSGGKSNSLTTSTQSVKSLGQGQFITLPDERVLRKETIAGQKQQLDKIGLQSIKNGQVAVFLLSGSQNLSLNLDFPLGVYDIGLDSAASIFEILVLRLSVLQKLSGANEENKIKLYILTNSENKQNIKNHFKTKNYFNYGQNNIFFFSQNLQPVVDEFGKIVLKDQGRIMMNSVGDSSIFSQIKSKKLIDHLRERGIKYSFIENINNILMKIANPCSLGILIKESKQIVASCFQSEEEDFGYFGLTNHQTLKIYQERVNRTGKKWAFTGSSWLTFNFLQKIIANKKFMQTLSETFTQSIQTLPTFSPQKNKKVPTKCIIFHSKYHQCFDLSSKITLIEIFPENDYAPIKNLKGKYSIQHARNLLRNMNKQILEKVGVQFQGQGHVQLYPGLTYDGQGIQQLIEAGKIKKKIRLPEFIHKMQYQK